MRSTSASRRTRVLAGRAARLAGHVVVAALCLELAARLDDRLTYGAPFFARYEAEAIHDRDADGTPMNVPGAAFEKWRVNGLGFRGEPIPVAKTADRRRVACVGTSESFGLYEREGGEWPARLQALSRARHPAAEVFNASAIGLQRDTRQRYLDRYVLPLRPDVVVLYFSVLWDATYRPVPARPPLAQPDRLPASRALPKLRRSLKSAFPAPAWQTLQEWRLARSVRRHERAVLGDRPPLDVLAPEAVAGFEAHLREMVAAQRARGILPVLATYPTLGSVANRDTERLGFLGQRYWQPELSDLGLIDAAAKLNDAVRRVARELAVPLADADAAVPKTAAYFADYVHYTDAGAERVAETVLAALEAGGLLDAPSQSAVPVVGRGP